VASIRHLPAHARRYRSNITALKSFGSGFGCSSTIRKLSKLDSEVIVRLGVLHIDHIFSSVFKSTDQHKGTKGPPALVALSECLLQPFG
jgi:hypothetical protein